MGLAIGSDASVTFDKEHYCVNSIASITLRDIDLNEDTATTETVAINISTSGGDSETVILTETQGTPGVFVGVITLVESNAVSGNDRLDVMNDQTITVSYTDADDGMGGVDVLKTKTADIDGLPPQIINVHFGRISSDFVEVMWETSEPASCIVKYGDVDLDSEIDSSIPATQHTIILPDLAPCNFYHFIVQAQDIAGNITTDDNNGLYYRVNTLSIETKFAELFDTDPGWSIEGLWAFGQPTGQGGEHGNPDPATAHTGSNVYGYNLDGDYPDNSAAFNLTTTVLDCSDMNNTMLSYWRWLGVERNMYDNASIEISTDGSTYTEIWKNPDIEQADSEWVNHELDIAEYADGQSTVYIRWIMGSTDAGWKYCGWNIDDVILTGTGACEASTPTPRPTATPEPSTMPATGIHLAMTDTSIVKDDVLHLTYCLRNGMQSTMTVDVFIALEVYGSYWFWPSWISMDEGIAFDPSVSVSAASEMTADVIQFTWPEVEGKATGLFFYGLLLDSASGLMQGDLSWICWEYR